jgi:hypothetical protein
MTDRVEMLRAGLDQLLAAIHADDPKRELLVRVGDLMREAAAQPLLGVQRPEDVARTFDPDSDSIQDLVASVPMPTKEKAIGGTMPGSFPRS